MAPSEHLESPIQPPASSVGLEAQKLFDTILRASSSLGMSEAALVNSLSPAAKELGLSVDFYLTSDPFSTDKSVFSLYFAYKERILTAQEEQNVRAFYHSLIVCANMLSNSVLQNQRKDPAIDKKEPSDPPVSSDEKDKQLGELKNMLEEQL